MRCVPQSTAAAPRGGLPLSREGVEVIVDSLAPQVRVSLDGKWLAWRPVMATSAMWTMIALAGGSATAQVSDRAVEHWHALVAAAPLLSTWRDEIRRCIGDQHVEACSECMGLTIAIDGLHRAAQL